MTAKIGARDTLQRYLCQQSIKVKLSQKHAVLRAGHKSPIFERVRKKTSGAAEVHI